jgi:predicted RNase H-like HicB family nuclease
MTGPETCNESAQPTIPEGVWEYPNNCYACDVYLAEETIDGWIAHVPALPGVVSEGDTLEDALENIREALCASIQAYQADGQPIPWKKPQQRHEREAQRFILVHCGDVP